MNESEKKEQIQVSVDEESFDFDELEKQLEERITEQLSDLEKLEEERSKIDNPDNLGDAVLNVVWDQFINQVGVVAGEDFVAENRGLRLDLRSEAHIQTTEHFEEGRIASHNDKIDYQKRYDDWQAGFEKDADGKIVTHTDRTGKEVPKIQKGARKPFDEGRPMGSKEKKTDMDHTVSAGEILRDPAANAHMSKEEQIDFANSEANLNEMDSSQNRSKGDMSTTDWLDNPNARGQKPKDIFDMTDEDEKKLRQKDSEAREELDKRIEKGKAEAEKTGRQSQKEEAFRIGGKALRSVIMGLLAELFRNIIGRLIAWFKAGKRNFEAFIDQMKEAILAFVKNLKRHVLTAGNTLVTTIASAIVGPIVTTIKKIWIMIKQGGKSIKEAIDYIKNPENREKSIDILMLEVGKIILAGITAVGSLLLGEAIEKALMSFPVFAVQIPLIGSLASLLGIFLGAVVCGIAGALLLDLINKLIAKKKEQGILSRQIVAGNEVLVLQGKKIQVDKTRMERKKAAAQKNITDQHRQAAEYIKEASQRIADPSDRGKFDHEIKEIDELLGRINEEDKKS